MQREQIRQLALENGFKLKTQSDGGLDLNPYVYDFARALIQTAQLQAQVEADKWISVDDRLPRANDVVLVSFGGAIEMDFIETRLNGQIIGWRRFNQDPPTHWRPLPELPTAQEGE